MVHIAVCGQMHGAVFWRQGDGWTRNSRDNVEVGGECIDHVEEGRECIDNVEVGGECIDHVEVGGECMDHVEVCGECKKIIWRSMQ